MPKLAVALPALVLLCACGRDPAQPTPPPSAEPAPPPSQAAALPPLNPPAPGEPGGLADDRTPLAEGPIEKGSAQDAANVVQTYYALIGEGRYDQAWALREPDGLSQAEFTNGFAAFSEYHANIGGPGRIDAGAGQRHVTVPVQIYARHKDGRPLYQIGTAVLHRTADIDGASDAQKRWRISAITLTETAGGAAR